MPLAPNTKLGRYQVRTRLGAGGMGEVYSAEDTQLERTIALKVLHPEVASDEGRMRRFTQEAKAAAALNHPHIAHIYEIGEAEGTTFMAMELIDGDTLRQKIHRDKASLNRLLEWLTQVADGLAKAHAAGIVHRDLKPDNIMVSRDGYAKILDFGLAKLIEPQKAPGSETSAASEIATAILAQPLSIPGMIMGTVGYMSPEQARGQTQIDGRSDIFSFGCILYEAVTKRKPFAGETVVDSLHNIIHEQPPPMRDLNPAVSSDLQRIVRRCLAKDPEDRFQTIKDVATELKELRREMETTADAHRSVSPDTNIDAQVSQTADRTVGLTNTGSASTAAAATAHSTSSAEYIAGEIKRHKRSAVIAALVLLLIVGGITFALYKFGGRPARSSQAMKVEKLTTNGKSSDAAISPDGKYVVYVLNEGGQRSLWTRQVATTSNVQIIPSVEQAYGGISFSPDGNYINFVRTEKSALAGLYQMPLLGGTQKKLINDADSAVSYSPDGRQFAYMRGNFPKLGESALLIANSDGTGERVLALKKRPETFPWWQQMTPAWSTDGKSIVCAAGGDATGSGLMTLVEVQVADGTIKPVPGPGWYEIKRIASLPDQNGFLVLGADKPSAYYSQQIWHIGAGGSRRITTDFNDYVGMSVTADANALVAVQSNRISNIWVAPINDSSRAVQIKSGGNNQDGTDGLAWTPDGRVIFYSRASGADDIWIMNADGGGLKQLTVDAGTNYDCRVTPDGRFIVFTSERNGQPNIWRMDLDGGNAKQLTSGNSDFSVTLSPDSKWIIYESSGSGKPGLRKVSIDGGEVSQLTDYAAENPEISPDGKSIACEYREDANSPWRYAIIPFEGGKPLKVFDFPTNLINDFRWTPDGRSLSYVETRSGVSNVWSFPLDGTVPKQLTDFKSDQIYNFKWSPDGKQLVLARGTITSDVVLIRDFR